MGIRFFSIFTFIVISLISTFSWAVNFEKLQSSKNHPEIWYMKTTTVPTVSFQVSFPIGYAHDAQGKEGLANLAASTMDEGAGDLTSTMFRDILANNQISLYFTASDTRFTLHVSCLKYDIDTALYLAELALNKPRFDKDSVDLIRNQIITTIRNKQKNSAGILGALSKKFYYNSHPFSKPDSGYIKSLQTITRQDLINFQKKLAKENSFISAVGDISKPELVRFSEKLFSDIPETSPTDLSISEYNPIAIEKNIHSFLDVPQTNILLMSPAIKRNSPDFLATYLGLHVLGGGGFGSELVSEIREKNGLTYSISSYLSSSAIDGRMMIQFSTDNKNVDTAISKVKHILRKLATQGISPQQFIKAKTNLKGQYTLSFETNQDIATLAQALFINNLSHTYPQDREKLFDALKIEDINRALKKTLNNPLTIIAVGGNKNLNGFQSFSVEKIDF